MEERVEIGQYYYKIDSNDRVIRVKETGSKKNDEDFDLANYYLSPEDAYEAQDCI